KHKAKFKLMLQSEHSQLIKDLSWEKIGQAIVDTVVRLVDIDIAILYLEQLPLARPKYFFYQKSSADILPIDLDLLKLTITPQAQIVDQEFLTINWQEASNSWLQLKSYQACLAANIASTVTIPLFNQVNLVASLTIHRFQKNSCWQQQELTVIKMMATHANLMLSQMLAREKLLELANRETTINRITATIRSSLEPPVMFAAIAKELGLALKVDGCSLSLWTKSDRFMQCVGLYNPHEAQKIIEDSNDWRQATTSNVPISENPILQALLFKKKTIDLSDLEQQQQLARYELPWHARARALMIVPLIVEDEIIGSITLRQSDASRNWSPSEIELAEAVADQAAIAVQQAKLYQKLKIEEQKVRKLNNYLTESVLKRFLPETIVNKAATGQLSLYLSPEPRRITVLFCDLADFTNLSSQLDVLSVAEILNEYLEAMTRAVFDRGGTVDKFIGDGIMAMFGAPEDLSCPEQASRAIATAKTMYFYLHKLNERWQAKAFETGRKIPILKMRCGIHQGKAVVGMFGGKQRKDYTAVGKVVNIAARLEGAAAPNSILISEAVANCLKHKVDWGQGNNFKLKGIERDFRAFTVRVKSLESASTSPSAFKGELKSKKSHPD
ncbi:MAG: adenylate/guanylate cyclase domain-containing protein, partial [Cyanobacteria bacterium J06638_38]